MAKSNAYIISILLIGNLRLGQGEIYGVLRCNFSGDANAPPVSGAPVYIRCAGSSTNIAEAVTNPNGTFTVVLNALQTLFVSPSNCYLLANLPGGNCSLIVPDCVLTATFNLVSIIQTNNKNTAVFLANQFVESIL